MKTEVKKGEKWTGGRSTHFVIETREDYAVAWQRIAAFRGGPKDNSSERELAALIEAIRAWDDGIGRKPGYPA
jgi:hypothetical protein